MTTPQGALSEDAVPVDIPNTLFSIDHSLALLTYAYLLNAAGIPPDMLKMAQLRAEQAVTEMATGEDGWP